MLSPPPPAGAQLAGAGQAAVPAQVTWTGLLLMHSCSTTSQDCHSGLLHRTVGTRARVAFGVLLAFLAAQSGGSSKDSRVGWPGTGSAPPQSSTRHTASVATRPQNFQHGGSQDCPS